MKKITVILLVVFACLFAGCAKTNERDVFRFEAHQLDMKLGEKIELKLVMGSVSKDEKIVYSVDQENIVTLDGNMITAVGVGVVRVTAKVESTPTTRATVEINVSDEKLSALKINGNSEIQVTKSLNLTVETIPNTITKEVVWSSSDEKIATVDQNGKVTTFKPGDVVISATSKYDSKMVAQKAIKVLYFDSTDMLLEITEGTEEVVLGSKTVVKATVLPELANQNVTWTSSNPQIATVKDGVITPVKVNDEETVTITAVSGDGLITKTLEVKVVYAEIEKIDVTCSEEVVEVFEEKTINFKATVTPQYANQEITWTSSDESIATVDQKGKVTGVKKGVATIIATGADGKSFGELQITVIGTPDPESISITLNYKDIDSLEIEEECDETIRIKILPDDAKQEIIITIEDPEIVSVVKGNGYRLTGLKVGKTTVTFTSAVDPSVSKTITIEVIPLE